MANALGSIAIHEYAGCAFTWKNGELDVRRELKLALLESGIQKDGSQQIDRGML